MATYEHIITNGPSKWDLMLAIFDNADFKRLLTFTVESSRYRELKAKLDTGGYDGLTRDEQVEVDVYDFDMCPREMKVLVFSIRVDGSDEKWKIDGIDMEHHNDVTLRYSTKTRKGKYEIGRYYLELEDDVDIGFVVYNMPCDVMSTCDWCKKPVEIADLSRTYDCESICSACYEQDEHGLQIARYGRAYNDLENEGQPVRDEEGKVDYE